MSANRHAASNHQSIITARVNRARRELIAAIVEAAEQASLTRYRAEGKLSALLCEVWNEAERKIRRIPLREQD